MGLELGGLQRKVLGAAALGSLKLLRSLLHLQARRVREARRAWRKRARDADFELGGGGREKKRAKGEADSGGWSGKRDTRRDWKRKSVREEASSGEEAENGRPPRDSSRAEEKRDDRDASLGNRILTSRRFGHAPEPACLGGEEDPKRRHVSSTESVRRLVNCRDEDGMSVLHHACHAGSEKVAEYLIAKGASVHARDSKGNTAMHIAARLGPPSLIAILRIANADIEACNDEGMAPSDILFEKETESLRARRFADEQSWRSHLAEELSDEGEMWWGAEWGDEPEQQDWDDHLLERRAEHSQRRGLYDEPFNLGDFLNAEKEKTRSVDQHARASKSEGEERGRRAPPKVEIRKSPDIVRLQPNVLGRAQRYSQRWKTFSESCDLCLSYSSVPFPVEEGEENTLAEVLLRGVDPTLHKAALRNEMLKWHPDKFLQKWGPKVQGPDHDRIVARVNWMSEAILELYKSLAPPK